MRIDEAAHVLGVEIGASPPVVEAAYRRRARETHPDRGAGSDSSEFVRVGLAREVLLRHAGVEVVTVSPGPGRLSIPLLATWIGLAALATFLILYRAAWPLNAAAGALLMVAVIGCLVGFALTGRTPLLVVFVISVAVLALLVVLFATIGALIGLLVLVASTFGLLLMGLDSAKRRALR